MTRQRLTSTRSSLRQLSLFAGCTSADLDALSSDVDLITVPAGTVVDRLGTGARQFIGIVDGYVHGIDTEGQSFVLGPGDHIGAAELFAAQPHPVTFTTSTTAKNETDRSSTHRVSPPVRVFGPASRRLSVTDGRARVFGPASRWLQVTDGWARIAILNGSPTPAVEHNRSMRLGIAHHFGWAVAVTASVDHQVVDRRRIELVEPGVQVAPIHHVGGPHLLHRQAAPLDDRTLAALVADVRASAIRATSAALAELVAAVAGPIVSMSLRAWPDDFPDDVAVQRHPPFESSADSVMYRQVLATLARDREWDVCFFDANTVEAEAARLLGDHAHAVLYGPRATLGAPWSKDHRMALAATIVA